jgi:hypothetical protein
MFVKPSRGTIANYLCILFGYVTDVVFLGNSVDGLSVFGCLMIVGPSIYIVLFKEK